MTGVGDPSNTRHCDHRAFIDACEAASGRNPGLDGPLEPTQPRHMSKSVRAALYDSGVRLIMVNREIRGSPAQRSPAIVHCSGA